MAAFVRLLRRRRLAAGRRVPDRAATSAAASGAAFMTVVLAQAANAFACRSSTRWPGDLGWTTNRLLLPAIAIGLAFSLVVLLVPPIAHELGQATPPLVGWLMAFAAPGSCWRSTPSTSGVGGSVAGGPSARDGGSCQARHAIASARSGR